MQLCRCLGLFFGTLYHSRLYRTRGNGKNLGSLCSAPGPPPAAPGRSPAAVLSSEKRFAAVKQQNGHSGRKHVLHFHHHHPKPTPH